MFKRCIIPYQQVKAERIRKHYFSAEGDLVTYTTKNLYRMVNHPL